MSKYDTNQAPSAYDETWRRHDVAHDRLTILEKKKLVGVRMRPVWENGWGDSSDSDDSPYYYYLILHGTHLKTEGFAEGGSSGTVAYTLPTLWRPNKNIAWNGHVVDTSHIPASFFCLASTGEVTITF